MTGRGSCHQVEPLIAAYNQAFWTGNRTKMIKALQAYDEHIDKCRKCHKVQEDE